MKWNSIFVTGAALLAFASVSFADDKSGWVELFDGKTLKGWKHSTIGTAKYSVVDGAIKGETVEGSPNTFLLSEEQYGDFELEFEVKVHDKLNSGCQIRSREKTEADVSKDDGKKRRNNGVGRFFRSPGGDRSQSRSGRIRLRRGDGSRMDFQGAGRGGRS